MREESTEPFAKRVPAQRSRRQQRRRRTPPRRSVGRVVVEAEARQRQPRSASDVPVAAAAYPVPDNVCGISAFRSSDMSPAEGGAPEEMRVAPVRAESAPNAATARRRCHRLSSPTNVRARNRFAARLQVNPSRGRLATRCDSVSPPALSFSCLAPESPRGSSQRARKS